MQNFDDVQNHGLAAIVVIVADVPEEISVLVRRGILTDKPQKLGHIHVHFLQQGPQQTVVDEKKDLTRS